jgi:hypothetical protein
VKKLGKRRSAIERNWFVAVVLIGLGYGAMVYNGVSELFASIIAVSCTAIFIASVEFFKRRHSW